MPLRTLLIGCLLLVAGCGGGSGSSLGVQGPPSAQSVAESSTDFSGLQKCSESGAYDTYLKAEQAKAPDQYSTDKKTWDDLKTAGANDGYIVVVTGSASDCGKFVTANISGKVAVVFAVRFKDSASAASAYNTTQGQFHMDDSTLANLTASGATVQRGAATTLGVNATTVSFDASGLSLYVALWQNKEFEVAMLTYSLPLTVGPAAATKINSRIR